MGPQFTSILGTTTELGAMVVSLSPILEVEAASLFSFSARGLTPRNCCKEGFYSDYRRLRCKPYSPQER
jgi:hypothetical protein